VGNFKSFDPVDIDETLTRVVTHGGATHLMFPYINAIGAIPKFNSVGCVIRGPTATVKDFHALSALVKQAGENAAWFISFNTPWLMHPAEAEKIKQVGSVPRGKRG
jgi:hypothetical protein